MVLQKILGLSPRIKYISAGYKHSGLVTEEGQLLMTGNNKEGQLGVGNNISTSRLMINNYLTDKIESVACGTNHTLVLTNISKLFGFGTNIKGQLGSTSRKHSNKPIPIMGFPENLRIIQLACSNFSGFLDEMGKLYLWGFGESNSVIEPLKQDNDVPIKYFSLWKDNCVIVDENGRVLTLDEQVYKSSLELECHFSVRVEGRTISQVSTGNKFFMCLPQKNYIRNPSTPNMADNFTIKTKTHNFLDHDHSENFTQKNILKESPNKEVMDDINNEDGRMGYSMKNFGHENQPMPRELIHIDQALLDRDNEFETKRYQ